MSKSQRIIKAGTFFNLPFILMFGVQEDAGGPAALRAHGINFESNSGGSANRQPRVMFGFSHADMIDHAACKAIQTDCEFRIGVCLTNTPYD